MSKNRYSCTYSGVYSYGASVMAGNALAARRTVLMQLIDDMEKADKGARGDFDFPMPHPADIRIEHTQQVRKKVPGRGDAAVLRQILDKHEIFKKSWFEKTGSIFNDKRKDGTRRLKVWVADFLQSAPRKVQVAVDWDIRGEFGDRFIRAYFIRNEGLWNGWSFCVELKQ